MVQPTKNSQLAVDSEVHFRRPPTHWVPQQRRGRHQVVLTVGLGTQRAMDVTGRWKMTSSVGQGCPTLYVGVARFETLKLGKMKAERRSPRPSFAIPRFLHSLPSGYVVMYCLQVMLPPSMC